MPKTQIVMGAFVICVCAFASACSSEAPTTSEKAAASPTPATQGAASTPAPAATTASPSQTAGKTVTVKAGNYAFEPKDLTVEAGTKVVWKNEAGRHTIVAEDKSFEKTEPMKVGDEFSHTFGREGKFPYYCSLHGAPGKDMSGTITVTARK